MDKGSRGAIERATQQARRLLEADFAEQLEATFDIRRERRLPTEPGAHVTEAEQAQWQTVIAAIDHKQHAGMSSAEAIADYLRDAAFTTLNRFVALKLLEARRLLKESISRGEQSTGYVEFCGLAAGIALLPGEAGYRLFIECLFDELSTEVKVLFDRRDPASVLWPRRQTLAQLLEILNAPGLAAVWSEDETIGWVYQYFNGADERKKMRDESQAPRNSRELAIRNQFFTPRYVVQFLVDNTLGRIWLEMLGSESRLDDRMEYFVRPVEGDLPSRTAKDPRDLKILDPACGSGHFLLYSFDLLVQMYEEAWADERSPASGLTGRTLVQDYPDFGRLRAAAPTLIVENNLYGVDIDARCAQIAALALWLRAQRAYVDLGVEPQSRPRLRRTNIVVAEPMLDDSELATQFADQLRRPFLGALFNRMVDEMHLAGDLGVLLRPETALAADIERARKQFVEEQPLLFPDLPATTVQGTLDLSGVTDEAVFDEAEEAILAALREFADVGGSDTRRRLFADDAAHGVALIDLVRNHFDVVLMNPPFGAASLGAKQKFESLYPRTKNDIYAAFVERGIELLHRGGMVGAITSRTGFFLSSFQRWREEVILAEAPPTVFADLGYGVMDAAMVEAAAYCLRKS